MLDALAQAGDGDIGLLPVLKALHINLRDQEITVFHRPEPLGSAVDIITKRKNSEHLLSIERVAVCAPMWESLAPHNHIMDKLVPNVIYGSSDVSFFQV